MKVEVKYAQGDLVKYIQAKRVHSAVRCSFCGGAGQIQGRDGTQATCPICDGIGLTAGIISQVDMTEGKIEDILIKYRGIEEGDSIKVVYKMSDAEETMVYQDRIIEKNRTFKKFLNYSYEDKDNYYNRT